MRIAILTLMLTTLSPAAPRTLDPTTAQHATGFMEWLFEVRFTPEQRDRYQRILESTWNGSNQGAIDAVAGMARIHENLGKLGEGERTALRVKTKGDFVRLLQQADDADSKWLLSVCLPAKSPAGNAHATSSALVGKWHDGYISSIQYQDAYTKASAPTNGRRFAWTFNADGTYGFTGLMQNVLYNCTTTMYSEETGRYSVEGNVVSIKPEKNPYKMTNTCAPSSNREAPGKLVERSYQFRVNGNDLELVGGDGSKMVFARTR